MATLYIKHDWNDRAGVKYPAQPSIMEWLLETDEGDPHAVTYWELLCAWAGVCEAIDAGLAVYNPAEDTISLTENAKSFADTFRARATH